MQIRIQKYQLFTWSLAITILALFNSCVPDSEIQETVLEDLRDPFKDATMTAYDLSSNSSLYTNDSKIRLSFDVTKSATKWCLTSDNGVILSSDNECVDGQGDLSGGWSESFPTSYDLSHLSDGTHTLYLWIVLNSGSLRAQPITSKITLDTAAPVVTVSASGNIKSSNVSSYSLSGSCSESSDVSITSGSFSTTAACSSSSWSWQGDVSSLSEGSVTFNITQTDAAENTSSIAQATVTKDTLAPSLTFTAPTNNSYTNASDSTLTFTGTCSEDGNLIDADTESLLTSCTSGTFSYVLSVSGLSEGSHTYNFQLVDSEGNTSDTESLTFTKDVSLPSVSSTTSSSVSSSQVTSFTLQGTCSENGQSISVSGDYSDSITCLSGNFSKTVDLSALAEGSVSLTYSLSDAAGNSNSVALTLTKDTIAPTLTESNFTSNSYTATDTVTFSGSCESGLSISISGAETTTTTCSSSAWSFTTSSQSSDASYTYSFQQTDSLGNTSSVVTEVWNRDTTGPNVTSLNINSGASSTGNNNTLVSLAANDTNNVEEFCLKYNDTSAPATTDSCWVALTDASSTVSTSVTVTDYPFKLGAISGDYNVYAWFKDSLDNISTLSASGSGTQGTDLYLINYELDEAPVFESLTATASDSPSSPLTTTDTTILVGNDLYVKWRITDNNAIPSGNIDIYYTTDNSNYTLLASGLDNGVNGSCTLTGTSTGCYYQAVSSPTSSYYKVKVVVQDSGVSQVFSHSNNINTGSFNVLTGNTSLGIGASANSAILIGEGEANFNDAADPQALAVTKTGTIFYKYKSKGVLYVNPEDGLLKYLLKDTNSTSGDGGSVFDATANSVKRITLDYDGNLIVYDNDQLRKVDLSSSPWSISTIAGGGPNSPENEVATDADLPSISGSLVPMRNGRLYFPSGKELWYLDSSDGLLKKELTISGLGTHDMVDARAIYDNSTCTTYDLAMAINPTTSTITKLVTKNRRTTAAECGAASASTGYSTSYNTTTGVAEAPHPPISSWSSVKFTGLDGKLYVLTHARQRIQVYNPDTNTWDTILGGVANGRCDDDTDALSCAVYAMSAFVDEYGKLYFVDMGVIRYIDDNDKVQTLAGQPRNFGPGHDPLLARYSQINFFDFDGTDIYIKNKLENQIVSFDTTGGNLELVAGNSIKGSISDGDMALTSSIPNCSWSMPCGIMIDSANNRLYHNNGTTPFYIDLTTKKWVAATESFQSNSRNSYQGKSSSGNFLVYSAAHYGTSGNEVLLYEYDPTADSLNHIYGRSDTRLGLTTNFTAGQVGTDSTLAHTQSTGVILGYSFDSISSSWVVAYNGRNDIYFIPEGGGTVTQHTTLNNSMRAFDYFNDGANEYVFYCSTGGNLYKKDLSSGVETQITIPVPSISCTQHTMRYDSANDRLLFIFTENGLYGLAQYQSP